MFYLISGGIVALVLVSYILIDPKKKRLNVKDELVVITGGTSGLGLEIALECLRRGAKVILLARKTVDVSAHDKLKRFDGQVKSISCDVTKRDDLERTRNELFSLNVTLKVGCVIPMFICPNSTWSLIELSSERRTPLYILRNAV